MKNCHALSHQCNLSLWVSNVFVLVATVKATYEFPTYPHPVYTNQLCYKCPPGYIKINDCPPGGDASIPAWPKCAKCGANEYMDDWNVNLRCKSQITCGPTHLPCGKTSTVSKAECTCHSSSIENERGDCVKGVAKSEYDQELNVKNEEMKQCQQTLSNLQNSIVAATPRTLKTTTATSPIMGACSQPLSDTEKVLIVFVVLLIACLLISVVLNVYQHRKYRKTSTNKSNGTNQDVGLSAHPELGEVEIQETEMTDRDRRDRPPDVAAIQQQSSATSEDRNPLLQRDDDSADDEPAFLENDGQMAENYLDKALLILEKSVRSSKNDLDELMRDVFGFEFILCEHIKKTGDDVTSNLRQAFSTWIRKQSENATPEALVRALGEHEWNAEADKIAKHYNISRENVETDDDEVELNIGIKTCEKMITLSTHVRAFVRNCLGIENIETTNMEPSADVIRKAFKMWKRKYSLKATVHFLIQQLLSNNMIDVAQHICEELEKRNSDGRNSEIDAKDVISNTIHEDDSAASQICKEVDADFGEVDEIEGASEQLNDIVENVTNIYIHKEDATGGQINKKAFSSNITEGPAEDDKAQPIYPPGSQPPDDTVRELTQPTADVVPFSDSNASCYTTTSEDPPAENKDDPRTVPKEPYGFDGRPVTYDDCDKDDPAVLKVDDENYGRPIEEIDVFHEPAAGGGKSANQTQEELP